MRPHLVENMDLVTLRSATGYAVLPGQMLRWS
jgi:hypothetical protein